MINEDVVGGVIVIIVDIDKVISDFTGSGVVILIDVADKVISDLKGRDVIFDEDELPVRVVVFIFVVEKNNIRFKRKSCFC